MAYKEVWAWYLAQLLNQWVIKRKKSFLMSQYFATENRGVKILFTEITMIIGRTIVSGESSMINTWK